MRYALLKGWHNYLCLQRLEQAMAAPAGMFDDGRRDEIDGLRAWAERTSDGSLSDLPVAPRPEAWEEVAAESDLCGRLKCPHFEKCFLFKARRLAAQADVVVVNHHLLLSDLAVRRASQNWGDAAVLPAYTRLVIDEGHHLEDAAVSHLGSTVTRRALERLLARLDRRGKGLLSALTQRLSAHDDLLSTASLDLVHARLAPAVHAARDKGALLFDLLATVLTESGQSPLRLTADFASHPAWAAGLDVALTDLLGEIVMLREGLRLVRERLETDERRAEAVAPLLAEMRAVTRRLEGIGDGLTRALRPPPDAERGTVRWLEARGKEKNVAAVAVPFDVAPILREDLFLKVETTVITSATLTSEGEFAFIRQRLGLDQPEVEPETAVFPSPFDYAEQSVLVVPMDLPGAEHRRAGAPRGDRRHRARSRRSERRRIVRALHEPRRGARGGRHAARRRRRCALAGARARRGDRATPCCAASANRGARCCSARRASGRAWTSRGRRCARCSSRSSPSACRASRSPRRTARRSRSPAAIRSASTCCRTRR